MPFHRTKLPDRWFKTIGLPIPPRASTNGSGSGEVDWLEYLGANQASDTLGAEAGRIATGVDQLKSVMFAEKERQQQQLENSLGALTEEAGRYATGVGQDIVNWLGDVRNSVQGGNLADYPDPLTGFRTPYKDRGLPYATPTGLSTVDAEQAADTGPLANFHEAAAAQQQAANDEAAAGIIESNDRQRAKELAEAISQGYDPVDAVLDAIVQSADAQTGAIAKGKPVSVERALPGEGARKVQQSPLPQQTADAQTGAIGTGGSQTVTRWGDTIAPLAAEVGVPMDVAMAIMHIESGGAENAVGTLDQNNPQWGQAQGLMQVMPFHFDAAYGWTSPDQRDANVMQDPETNIRMGLQLLANAYSQYGDWDKAAAAYFGAIENGEITGAQDANNVSGHTYVDKFRQTRALYAAP